MERRRDFGLAVKFLTLLPSTLKSALDFGRTLLSETGNIITAPRTPWQVYSTLPSFRFSIDWTNAMNKPLERGSRIGPLESSHYMAICAIDEYWLSSTHLASIGIFTGSAVSFEGGQKNVCCWNWCVLLKTACCYPRVHFQAPEIAVGAVVGADGLSGWVQYFPLSKVRYVLRAPIYGLLLCMVLLVFSVEVRR